MNEPATSNADVDSDADNAAQLGGEEEASKEQHSQREGPTVAEKAIEQGHQSLDDWVESGKDADQWQPPEVYLQLKPAWSKIKDQAKQNKNLQKELEAQRSFYGQQVENLREELNTRRDTAVEEADVTRFNEIQKQIDNLPAPAQPGQNDQLSDELKTWNADPKNSWYRTDEAKQALADRRFLLYKQQNYTDGDAIALMQVDVDKRFPPVNANRDGAPPSEGGSKPGRKSAPRRLSLSDLTPKESSIWRHRPDNMWKNEEEFLKQVVKSREAEANG